MSTDENMAIWNVAKHTDPSFTKSFRRQGGFGGTAVNQTYRIMRATEVFGPVGIGFGWKVLQEQILTGAPILSGDGAVIAHEQIHLLKVELWYQLLDDKWGQFKGRIGKIESYGQTTFVGRDRNGLFTDEEAPKKSLTDAVTKALSWLGFAADVHMGFWDDDKYVSDMKRRFAEGGVGNGQHTQTSGEDTPIVAKWRKLIAEAQDAEGLRSVMASANAETKAADDKAAWVTLYKLIDTRRAALGIPRRGVMQGGG